MRHSLRPSMCILISTVCFTRRSQHVAAVHLRKGRIHASKYREVFLQAVLARVDHLLDRVTPSQTLFVAIDGPACAAKLAMVEPHVHGSTFMMLRILVWLTSAAAFKVVDVGAPRSGTQSLKLALQMLGYKPLHSGLDHWSRPAWCQYKFGHGSFEAALEIPLALGYDAAMDEPFQLLYREFMAAFPDAGSARERA
eukprot:g8882.t1